MLIIRACETDAGIIESGKNERRRKILIEKICKEKRIEKSFSLGCIVNNTKSWKLIDLRVFLNVILEFKCSINRTKV